MAESQPDKSLAKSASNVSTGVHLKNSPVKVKDTHLMNNNQPMAEILCGDCRDFCRTLETRFSFNTFPHNAAYSR